jgi:dihydroorotate dehydrogenase
MAGEYMRIGEYEMESPLMNAGGLVKSVEDVRIMAQTGIGAVLAGSFTLEPRAGNGANGERVYYRDVATDTTYNSLGMPNKGIVNLAANLNEMIDIAHDHGKPFVLNFAPVSDDPRSELITMAEVLSLAKVERLDGFELNASCPNVVTGDGGRHELLSHHPKLLEEVLFELSDIAANELAIGTLLVRISPFKQEADAVNLAKAVQSVGVNVVSAFNTFPGGVPVDSEGRQLLQVPGGAGGQSGGAMTSIAEEQTGWLLNARQSVSGTFEIIGSNGIVDAETMKRRLDLGVAAVSATTLFWEAHSWARATDDILQAYGGIV